MRILYSLIAFSFIVSLHAQELSRDELNRRAKDNGQRALNYLQANITTIADKKNPFIKRTRMVEDISARFMSTAIIQTASKRRPDKKYNNTPKRYFEKLRDYRYENVFISFDFEDILDFKELRPGRLWMVEFSVGQEFTATRDGRPVYNDFTIKSVAIYLSKVGDRWAYRFGDIKVLWVGER